MGHKIHPKGIRLGYIEDWVSKWFNLKKMPDFIEEDYKIRQYIKNKKLKLALISKIIIERPGNYLRIGICTARPGIVIGKGGQGIEQLKIQIESITKKKTFLNVLEVKHPEIDAQLVSENISFQLEKQMAFRRVIKKAIEKAINIGKAKGIKVMLSGRIGGAEIARSEWVKSGRIPLQTFRANIDYGFSEAKTTMGKIGVKVWIFKGELFMKKSLHELFNEAKRNNNSKSTKSNKN
ncbi:MAG: 30S ribosomal protein S3 [Endomicrobium sp.]|jgi:small subunit ribosomal protein S3|nr:30S ribosomal protein S3 [Endomicrobium sp.]